MNFIWGIGHFIHHHFLFDMKYCKKMMSIENMFFVISLMEICLFYLVLC